MRVAILQMQNAKCKTMRLHARPTKIGCVVSRSLTVSYGQAGTSPLIERIETFARGAWSYDDYVK